MIFGDVVFEISIVILIALVLTAIMRVMRQPLIVGYILSGIIVSPFFLDFSGMKEGFEPFAKIGISLLLFSVGLGLNPKYVKKLGKVSLITGITQLVLTFVIGYFIAILLGFNTLTGVYIALALSFSSTIVIMKLLSDKEEAETVHGRIAIGFLIVQDLVHIIALVVLLTATSIPAGVSVGSAALNAFLKMAVLVTTLFILGNYVLPPLNKQIAKSQEMLLFFSIGWALGVSALFEYLHLSMEVGALLAGVALSISPYKYEITSKLKPLRDFFLLIFFISLGLIMVPINMGEYIVPIIAFSLLILIGTPIIVMSVMGYLGYTKRNSFLSGVLVAQISEFSFILTALGVTLGHISAEILTFVIMIGLVTIIGSSYTITHSHKLYNYLSRYLTIFERKGWKKVDEGIYHIRDDHDVILFGYNRIGYDLLETFRKMKKRCLVVDNNPETIQKLAKRGIDSRYGDANDVELLEDLNFKKAKMIISTIPEKDISMLLMSKLKRVKKNLIFILVAHNIDDALELYNAGASYVILPHFLGGRHTAHLIDKFGFKRSSFQNEKSRNRSELLKRKRDGQRHPRNDRG